MIIQLNK